MKRLILLLLPFGLMACNDPPPLVDACLLKMVKSADGSFDAKNSKAFCTPVDPKKKPYILTVDQLDKYYSYSNQDNAILNQWIISHIKK